MYCNSVGKDKLFTNQKTGKNVSLPTVQHGKDPLCTHH